MAEKLNVKRVSFATSRQKEFLDRVFARISLQEAAGACSVSERTMRDWRREKFLIDLISLRILSKKAHISFPRRVILRDRYWYTSKGAKRGWEVVYRKYGRVPVDEEYRKKKWREWWERKGKYSFHPILNTPKKIKRPRSSRELAEFVGIILGDGGISKYQVTVTLHSEDDKEYGKYVVFLIKKLFSVPVGIYPRQKDHVVNFVVSRVELVRFCTEKLGLKVGNKVKQQIDIPDWIKSNKEYSRACVRGLVDTDGCIFWETHRLEKKTYAYPRLNFKSSSLRLKKSAFTIFTELGFSPRMRGETSVQLEDKKDILQYFQTVGTHNPKHLKRYKK